MDLTHWHYEEHIELFRKKLAQAETAQAVEDLKRFYLSKKQGLIGQLLQALRAAPTEQKPRLGKEVNLFKKDVTAALNNLGYLKQQTRINRLDLSLPGVRPPQGSSHPLTQTLHEMTDFFVKMGFDIADGPEIETAYYNFEALNTPASHPAREDADTFYINDDAMLRTQTSGVQVRYMETHRPPFRMVAPGRVYRRDDDVTHSPMFHQLEGLVVSEHIHFGHLKGTLEAFAKHMFGEETQIRLRPSYFPFTEPSAEVDVSCPFCSRGCRICKNSRWIEILGSGMVDPNVFEMVGYDSEKYTGFAFGMGIERVAMLRRRIPDIRYFYQNDRRFLDLFKGV